MGKPGFLNILIAKLLVYSKSIAGRNAIFNVTWRNVAYWWKDIYAALNAGGWRIMEA
jgi:hypothetical protein